MQRLKGILEATMDVYTFMVSRRTAGFRPDWLDGTRMLLEPLQGNMLES